MNWDEMRELLIEGIEAGLFVAVADGDEIRYYHIEHTDDEILERALSVDELKRFWSEHDE